MARRSTCVLVLATGLTEQPAASRASRTIVIHPGSRMLRIGRAADPSPLCIPNVISRRSTRPPPPRRWLPGIDSSLDPKLAALRDDYRQRVRFYKLRPTTNGTGLAQEFNAAHPLVEVDAEPAADDVGAKACLVGEAALAVGDEEGWALRWPHRRGRFNTLNYASSAEVLSDTAAIWTHALGQLGVQSRDFGSHSALLVIPDLFDHVYVRESVSILFREMGFKQVAVIQVRAQLRRYR